MKQIKLGPVVIAKLGETVQLFSKFESPFRVKGVELPPSKFELVGFFAGKHRWITGQEWPGEIDVFPPNAYVTVNIKNISDEEALSDECFLSVEELSPSPETGPVRAGMVVQGNVGATVAAIASARMSVPVYEDGWPKGGTNEVWVLLNRGEAERLVLAVKGYPIQTMEQAGLLRRFEQALASRK